MIKPPAPRRKGPLQRQRDRAPAVEPDRRRLGPGGNGLPARRHHDQRAGTLDHPILLIVDVEVGVAQRRQRERACRIRDQQEA